jgi:hypothetical protein
MTLALCIFSLFAIRVAAGLDRRVVPAIVRRKPLQKRFRNN